MKRIYENPQAEMTVFFRDDILFTSPISNGTPQEYEWGDLEPSNT